MNLSGQLCKELQDALIDAFPSKFFLEQMLVHELDKNLDAITGGTNLSEVIFNLIKISEAENWIENLVNAARRANPANQKLEAITEKIVTVAAGNSKKVSELEKISLISSTQNPTKDPKKVSEAIKDLLTYSGGGSIKEGRNGKTSGYNSTTWDYYTYPGKVDVQYYGDLNGNIIYYYGCVERRKKWSWGVERSTHDFRPNGRVEANFEVSKTKKIITKVSNVQNIGKAGRCGTWVEKTIKNLEGKAIPDS